MKVNYYDVEIDGNFEMAMEPNWNALVYVISGKVQVGNSIIN